MRWFILIFSFLIIACESSTHDVSEDRTAFFDLADHMDRILDESPQFKKVSRTTTFQDELEEKVMQNKDLTELLVYLKQYNINRPKWYDKYEVIQNGSTTSYKAIDDDMAIKQLDVTKDKDGSIDINIDYEKESIISSSKKKIVIDGEEEIKINLISKRVFGKEQEVDIAWNMIR